MSVFTPIKIHKANKVHHSEYIRTGNKPDEETANPSEPASPSTSGAE